MLLIPSIKAMAYPNFIGKGYQACLTCHYNPFGNGPLNDYGRAVGATAIADRLFVSKDTSDEELGERSGFLFSKPNQTWFRPSLDYRGMQLDRQIDQDKPVRKFIHMQMDATITLKFGEADKYIATFTHGVIPDNSVRPVNGEYNELQFSKEHYIGIRPIQELGIYLGKMDKVFGIRVPDHYSYAKRFGNLHQYSASTGVMLHWGQEEFDWGVQAFDGAGHIEKKESEQTKGFTTKFEYSIHKDVRVGVSVLSEEDPNQNKKDMKALTAKFKVGNGSSVMAEFGEIVNTTNANLQTTSNYMFMQNHLNLTRGLYFITTFEYFQSDIDKDSEVYVVSPGLQYFPWQRVELRAELRNERKFSSETINNNQTPIENDSWDFIGQVHLWF
jgi:hypothetical protein